VPDLVYTVVEPSVFTEWQYFYGVVPARPNLIVQ